MTLSNNRTMDALEEARIQGAESLAKLQPLVAKLQAMTAERKHTETIELCIQLKQEVERIQMEHILERLVKPPFDEEEIEEFTEH